MDTIFGFLGYAGLILLLVSYYMLIIGHMKVVDTSYIMLNVVGALFIVLTLYLGGSVPVNYLLVVWLLLSLFGYYKHHIAVTE